jgi:hypothetical protein
MSLDRVPLYWAFVAALAVGLAGWLVHPTAGQAAPPAAPPAVAAAVRGPYQAAGLDGQHVAITDTRTGRAWTYTAGAGWSDRGADVANGVTFPAGIESTAFGSGSRMAFPNHS